jgi:putative ABC transport system permease protein
MPLITFGMQEILRRKVTFLLATGSVAVAAAVILLVPAVLKVYQTRAAEMLEAKEVVLDEKLKTLQDEMRKATLKMSFNLQILPGKQDVREWHLNETASTYMPEEYVHRMAASKILSVRHFFPMLSQKLKWPEMKRTIFLVGCKGEVPNLHKGYRAPLVQPVPKGTIIVGHELQQSLDLKKGQQVQLLGREFVIHDCYEHRGTKDDIGVWIPLKDAQELLNKPGMINAILALECSCAATMGIEQVRNEIKSCLPDTRVIELGTNVLARNEARAKVKREAQQALQREKDNQQMLANERESLAAVLLPSVLGGCAAWIFLMAMVNVRTRSSEIAILRAIGYQARHVLLLLLFRWFVGGVVGALLGTLLGVAIALSLRGGMSLPLVGSEGMLSWGLVFASIGMSAMLGLLAGWIPALLAAQRDPADVLKEVGGC